jgi:hypothetical protein
MWLVDDEVVTRWGMLVFITFISYIWHPWLMTKWHGCLIIITMIKNNYKSFDMNINNPTPTPTDLPTYPPMHPPTYLLPTYFRTYLLSTYLPTNPPIYVPTTHLPIHPPTYFLFCISYNLSTSYLSSYHLLPTS